LLGRSKALFIEKMLRAARRNYLIKRGGVTGAPVTELEYKLCKSKAVLDEAIYGDVSSESRVVP
jgi:hypothetical protein